MNFTEFLTGGAAPDAHDHTTVTVTWLDGSSETFTAHDTEAADGYLWLDACDLIPAGRGIPWTSMRTWTQA